MYSKLQVTCHNVLFFWKRGVYFVVKIVNLDSKKSGEITMIFCKSKWRTKFHFRVRIFPTRNNFTKCSNSRVRKILVLSRFFKSDVF